MTTIAYRAGVMASDTSMCLDTRRVGNMRKIAYSERAGALLGVSGEAWVGAQALALFKSEDTPIESVIKLLREAQEEQPEEPIQFVGLLVDCKGNIYLIERASLLPMLDTYTAIGSGASVALAAMDCGEGAKSAVKAAMLRDTYTGGKIVSIKLKPERPNRAK